MKHQVILWLTMLWAHEASLTERLLWPRGLIVVVLRIITMCCHILLGPRPTIGGHCSVGTGGEYKNVRSSFYFIFCCNIAPDLDLYGVYLNKEE